MQSLSKWLPLVGALICLFFTGNGGYVISEGLNSDGSNIGTIAQGLGSILFGLVTGGAGWYFKGGKVDTGTFDDDTQAVKHLVASCKGCPESKEALQVIHRQILQREFEPDE